MSTLPHGSVFESDGNTLWSWLCHCWASGFDYNQARDQGQHYLKIFITRRMFDVAMETCELEYGISQFGPYVGIERNKS